MAARRKARKQSDPPILTSEASLVWDQAKRARYRDLSRRELAGELTEPERQELQILTQEIESAEAVYLRPATEQLRRKREEIQSQNRRLQALVERKDALVVRLGGVLADAQAEREAIDEELIRILGESASSGARASN